MSRRTLTSRPILIVDREGTLGKALAAKLQTTLLTVFVSSQDLKEPNVISVPFHKKIPVIPDNSFSHIFIVHNGEKELLASLPSFIRKATETNAQLIFITSIFHFQDHVGKKLLELYKNTKIIVVGDVFEPSLAWVTPVTSLLGMAKSHGRVELTNSGLDDLYPIALSDVVEGINAIGIGATEPSQIYALFPQHPVTQLSFVRILQKLYPLLRVDFLKSKHTPLPYHLPSSAIFVLQKRYPLDDRLAALDLTHTPLAKSAHIKKKRMRVTGRKSSRKKLMLLSASLCFFLLSLPFLLTVGFAFIGGISLQQAEKQLERGELAQAYASAQSASSLFRIADDTSITLRSGLSLIGLSKEVIGFQSLIHTGKELSDAVVGILDAGVKLQKLSEGKQAMTKDEFVGAMNRLKQSMIKLQTVQVEGTLPKEYTERLKKYEKPLALIINLLDASPTLLGFDKPQKYLVLFQNNSELRPTGGFIGSYGILTMEKGKVSSFTIHDVYDADGKLTADIEPPFALKRYLGSSHWFLRDSNYHIDFAKSASQAVSFLKLETGESVQGVIGIDVTFLTALLDATGPIKLPDYNETLTKDNFYLLTQKYVENDFFPGSTQKKDFLRAAERELVNKFEHGEFSYQKLLQIIADSAAQKHLLFAFPDPTIQKLFAINNLSSTLKELRSKRENSYLDTIGINEANVGQNKSNYYLKRSFSHEIMIDGEGVVRGMLHITYTNTSNDKTEFGGDYKAYLRLITPSDTVLTDVLINKTTQTIIPAITNENIFRARSFQSPKGVEIEEVTEEGRELFGTLITVGKGETKTYSFGYRLAQRAPIQSQEWHYNLDVIKQPGTIADPYKLSVTYPLANKLFHSSFPVSDLGSKIVFETSLLTDQNLLLTFTQR